MERLDLPHGLAAPLPLWAISAKHNDIERARRAHARAVADEVAALVTKLPVPYLDDPVPASARTLERLAQSKGMMTRLHVGLEGCTLEARLGAQRLGFAVSWHRGRAQGALWYEPDVRIETVVDERPAPDAKVPRRVNGKTVMIADPRRMPRGMSREHALVVASPYGVPVNFPTVTARVKALAVG